MKLRNKKTGEIIDDGYVGETHDFQFDGQKHVLAVFKGNGHSVPERVSGAYTSLAELNEEWEDYEEPKEFWYIGQDGVIFSDVDTITKDYADRLKAIGNYFETEEEAKKIVEKLKAWKRLKDKGFDFAGVFTENGVNEIDFEISNGEKWNDEQIEEFEGDLQLLFGGEE